MKRLFPPIGSLVSCALLFSAPPVRAAEETAAVLSYEAGPYQEAYEAFSEVLGRRVPTINLAASGRHQVPAGTKVVVAFGGRAALQDYPDDAVLIYCLAPGITVDRKTHKGPVIRIHMVPPAEVLSSQLRSIQPKLKRLTIVWQSESFSESLKALRESLAKFGIDAALEKLEKAQDMPQRLRAIHGTTDALWIPPDPLLINSQNFTIFKEYSWANDIPFYAPTAGLAEIGAAAAISVSFSEVGRTAALAAQKALAGDLSPEIYPQKAELVINLTAAAACGLAVPPEAARKATKVLP